MSTPRATVAPETCPTSARPRIGRNSASSARGRRTRRIAVWVVAACVVPSLARVARAEPRIAITAGGCPTRDAMIFAIAQVIPSASIVPQTEALTGVGDSVAVVAVSDDGASYRVDISDTTRTFFDPQTCCDDRAGKAAVVIALALEPPAVARLSPGAGELNAPGVTEPNAPGVAEPNPYASVPMVPATAVPAHPPAGTTVQLEIGAAFERSWIGTDDMGQLGAPSGWLAILRGDLGVVLGGEVTAWKGTNALARVQRIPIELALRRRFGTGPLLASLELGPRLVIQRTTGFYMDAPHTLQLELDARLAARVELWAWQRCAVFAAGMAAYLPTTAFRSSSSPIDPYMSSTWFGVTLGVIVPLD